MKKHALLYALLFCSLFIAACGSSTSGTGATGDDLTSGLVFTSAADFGDSASAMVSKDDMNGGTCEDDWTPGENDSSVLEDGLDCDEDGGAVTHITPSHYSLALKRVMLLSDGGQDIELVADRNTLANSIMVDFDPTSPLGTPLYIDPENLIAGTYTGLEFEIYYFQLTFPVKETTRNVRFYMSDDDFTAEGDLGHHQGDITFVDDDSNELGWVNATWSEAFSDRAESGQAGAGGTDPETGHERGFFGDANLWNGSDQEQGANQDIFTYEVEFSSPISIPEPDEMSEVITILATFSAENTFFFEDFENAPPCDGFCPEDGAEAGGENAAWAPLVPEATTTTGTTDSVPSSVQ